MHGEWIAGSVEALEIGERLQPCWEIRELIEAEIQLAQCRHVTEGLGQCLDVVV